MTGKQKDKMWSGRFKKPLDPAFEIWQNSFSFDCTLIHEELAASHAYATALTRAGILTKIECKKLHSSLARIGRSLRFGLVREKNVSRFEDVHHYVETKLIEYAGEVGKKLHTGRSRNEQIATDLRLHVANACKQISECLAGLARAFVMRAKNANDAVMPAYTHLQRAEPVLVAHWLMAYYEMWMRDKERIERVRLSALSVCPLGSGAIAGSSVPLDRAALAKSLGFAGPSRNSMDATSDRDFAIEYTQALSLLSLHISRWSEEMVLYSTREFGFVVLPDQFSTGSSAMPQKKNPDAFELMRGMSGRIIGSMTSLLLTLKGLPLAYNKDLQEMQRPLIYLADDFLLMLPIARRIMESLEFNVERMRVASTRGHLNAMAAATYLSSKGVPFRTAHEQIGNAVQRAIELGCELEDLPQHELDKLGAHFGKDFRQHLSLNTVLACHDNIGGTAPRQVKRAISEALAGLKKMGVR